MKQQKHMLLCLAPPRHLSSVYSDILWYCDDRVASPALITIIILPNHNSLFIARMKMISSLLYTPDH